MENLQGGMLALEHRYAVDAEAGRQGLATVYRGTQHPFERPVTIRAFDLFEEAGNASELVEHIKKGAQLAASLDHDGVLRVVDFGELTADVPFVVSERGTGPSLATFLEQSGTMTLEEVVSLIERLAMVLDEAHMRGVIHGNLSPHVVTLPQKDVNRACIGQFGLSVPMAEIRKIDGAMLSFALVAGLAPELFKDGATPTRSSDIYAIGTLAYLALSGQHPYFEDVNDTSEGLLAIQTGTPRSLIDFGFSEPIWDALRLVIGRDSDARPESAQEVAEALREAAFPPKVESKPEPADESFEEEPERATNDAPSPGAMAWGVLLLVLIASNAAWFSWAGKAPVTREHVEASTPVMADVLRPGVELDSLPSGARVFLEGQNASELGETPLAVNPDIGANGRATIRLEKRGYAPTFVDVVPAQNGNRLVLKLTPVEP